MTSDHPPPRGWVCSCDCLPSVSGCTLWRGPEPILDHLSLRTGSTMTTAKQLQPWVWLGPRWASSPESAT